MDSQNSEDSDEIFYSRGPLKALSDSDSSDDDDCQEAVLGRHASSSPTAKTTPTSKRTRESNQANRQQKKQRAEPHSDSPVEIEQWGMLPVSSPSPVRPSPRSRRANTRTGTSVPVSETDAAADEAIRRNKEAMARLKKAAATAEVEELSDDDHPSDPEIEIVDSDAAACNNPGPPVVLVLRTKDNRQEEFTISQKAPLGELFALFNASEAGALLTTTLGRPAKFFFDGQQLKEHQTPLGCEMEDKDLIDVN